MLRLSPIRRLLVLLALALAGLGTIAWLCRTDARLLFLPAHAPAEWILYPNPPSLDSLPVVDSSAVFIRIFHLENAIPDAFLKLRAFRTITTISLNGQPLSQIPVPHNWKDPVVLDLGGMRAGDNILSITVANNGGPPALWAVLSSGTLQLPTDSSWQVSWAGAVLRPARLARDPIPAGPGSPLAGGEQPFHSLQLVWPLLTLMAVIAAALLLALRCALKFSPVKVPALALGLFVLMWIALFANNLQSIRRKAGFDSTTHLEYVQYLLSHHSLPMATQGFEMYQPPLYYVVSATLLGALGLTLDSVGVLVLNQLGLLISLANLLLIYMALRLVFPGDPKKQIVGLTVAAFLPANLCLSQFVTNEVLAAMLVTASLYLCLLLLRKDAPGWRLSAGLGLGLGAALLTKLTALVAVPFILGTLLAHGWRQKPALRRQWLAHVAAAAGLCLLVSGWHYGRLWALYGDPLVGNWDPVLGFHWWQYDGFRTAPYYLRFGAVLANPWFAGFFSLPDGIYSTLWGDGLLSGFSSPIFRMPWNYRLMAAGYLLALLPTLLLAAGVLSAATRFVRAPKIELVMLPGYAVASLAALAWMSLKVPSYAEVKSFYLLSTLLPVSVLAGLGWDAITRRSRVTTAVAGIALGTWALTSFSSVWIPAGSSSADQANGLDLWAQKRYAEAIGSFSQALTEDPANLQVRSLLAQHLVFVGRLEEALALATETVNRFPADSAAHADLAMALGAHNSLDEAIAQARQAIALAPDSAPAHRVLVSLLQLANDPVGEVQACREALRVSPLDATIHARLGVALAIHAAPGNPTSAALTNEACDQLRLSIALNPGSAETHNNLCAILSQLGQTAEAIDQYRQALKINPKDQSAFQNLQGLLTQQAKAPQ